MRECQVEVILPLCAFWGGAPRYIAACGLRRGSVWRSGPWVFFGSVASMQDVGRLVKGLRMFLDPVR